MENKSNKKTDKKIHRMTNKKEDNRLKKIVIKDKNKFYRTVSIFIIILLLIVIILIFGNRSIKIDNNTNIKKINISKYSYEVKLYYESLMNDFVTDYNNVQNKVWTYIYNEVVSGKDIESLIDEVNQILESDDLSSIGIEESTRWRGTYKIDKTSNALLFKFEVKEIEPIWIGDTSVSHMIEKNEE